jgi:hypothetical protein
VKYYILTTAGDHGLWWKPNRCGYTTNLNLAGQYEEGEARSIERIRGTDRAYACDDVDPLAETVRLVPLSRIPRKAPR